MAEGLTVIAAGLIVVLCIMASMFIFIEILLKLDQVSKDRAARASAPPVVADSAAEDAEVSRKREEVIAAIGLALHKHSAAGARRKAPTGTGSGPTPWASSGRLGIMNDRQRVTGRRT